MSMTAVCMYRLYALTLTGAVHSSTDDAGATRTARCRTPVCRHVLFGTDGRHCLADNRLGRRHAEATLLSQVETCGIQDQGPSRWPRSRASRSRTRCCWPTPRARGVDARRSGTTSRGCRTCESPWRAIQGAVGNSETTPRGASRCGRERTTSRRGRSTQHHSGPRCDSRIAQRISRQDAIPGRCAEHPQTTGKAVKSRGPAIAFADLRTARGARSSATPLRRRLPNGMR